VVEQEDRLSCRHAEALGVAPGIFKGTMTARRNGEKFDLPVPDKDQTAIKQG
jgi:hypothetical protein